MFTGVHYSDNAALAAIPWEVKFSGPGTGSTPARQGYAFWI
jgi:hypothetical protein